MKKLLLFLLIPLFITSCTDQSKQIETLNARLDSIQHSIDSISYNVYVRDTLDTSSTTQRMLSQTATATDSILIRQGEITLMPEIFAAGRVIGIGTTAQTLTQAGFSNQTAAAQWPRTASRYGTPIDAGAMTIDWICHQEMFYMMEDYGATYCESPGGKYYKFKNTAKLPKSWATNGRGSIRKFIMNGNGSAYNSISTTDIVLFDVYPTDQNNAMTLLGNQYVFRDMMVVGNRSKAAGNIGIRIGASTRPIFDNIVVDACGIGLDLQFCLETSITNINVSSYGIYGVSIRNGVWSGAAGSNAQSNIVTITNFRSYNASGYSPVAALYMGGNHTIWVTNATFEGHLGSQSHIFYDNTFSTGVNVFTLNNVYFEYASCSRAGVRIKAVKGQFILNQFRSSIVETDMKCLIEVEAVQSNGNWGAIHMMLNNSTVDKNKGKFRCIGSSSYPVKWYVTNINMANNSVFNSPENFDATVAGSYIPKSSACRFVAPL